MALIYVEQLEDLDVKEMQQTHEDEVKLLNEIDKLATQHQMGQPTRETLEVKIEAYLIHVKEHFSNEERLMKKYNFPSYEMHKAAHDIFLDDLENSVKQWRRSNNLDKIMNFIRKSPEWIVLHINSVDASTSTFIAQQIKRES